MALHTWRGCLARPEQLAPPGDWQTWLFLAGRGAGKTRSGSEWVREEIKNGAGAVALIAPTSADARDVMVEGQAGIIACSWEHDRTPDGTLIGLPRYEPSKRRLTWANGATATMFSAEEPERLRGPQHDRLWADELATWQYAQATWDMAMFGLRLGTNPRAMVTTTPRPIPLIRTLLADKTTVLTKASTHANRANLAKTFLSKIVTKYEGTRLGRQELNAEVLDDVPGALWTRAMLERARIDKKSDFAKSLSFKRTVVAIDPSGTAGKDKAAKKKAEMSVEGNADVGIIVAGMGRDGLCYVLEDLTCNESPAEWGKRSVMAYGRWAADRIVAEVNFGGAMVRHVIKTADPDASYKELTASRGKWIRAEPVAALFEQNRVKLVGAFPQLEDELCSMGRDGMADGMSPNRLDAMVWAVTELMLGNQGVSALFGSYGQ